MAQNPGKRKKKLERRNAKHKEKHRALVRKHNVGLPDRLSAASKSPVLDCWIGNGVAEHERSGMARYFRYSLDHKVVGLQYLVGIIIYFCTAGLFARSGELLEAGWAALAAGASATRAASSGPTRSTSSATR